MIETADRPTAASLIPSSEQVRGCLAVTVREAAVLRRLLKFAVAAEREFGQAASSSKQGEGAPA